MGESPVNRGLIIVSIIGWIEKRKDIEGFIFKVWDIFKLVKYEVNFEIFLIDIFIDLL